MSDYRPVCRASELEPGSARLVLIDGKEIALFFLDGEYHAMEDHCLHAGGPLHEGELDGRIVICPWHHWRFDLRDGSCNLNPKVNLETYPVRVRDGFIEIRYPAS